MQSFLDRIADAWNRRVSPPVAETPEPEEYSRSDMHRDGDFGPPITDEEAEMLLAAAKITPNVIRRLRANAARRQSPPGAEIVAGLSAFAGHLESGGTVDDWPGTHTRVIDDETC